MIENETANNTMLKIQIASTINFYILVGNKYI